VNNKLFVGNLPWSVDDASLEELFSSYGEVTSARVITDRESGKSRGFGFVEFESSEDAETAMNEMDGTDVEGRELNVDEAKPKN
jgi:RNA recognition motif-containing protein